MNILHLEASPGWGGQEMRILKEAEGMRQRGHTVVLAVMKNGALIDRARKAQFIVYEVNFRRTGWIFCLFRLLWILARHRIDLINTHSSLDSWIGGIAARLARKPVVRTRHLSAAVRPGFNSRFVYGTLADFVVTTCASIIPMICQQSGKKAHLCRSIATGVDPGQIRVKKGESEAFRNQLRVGPDDLLVGTACFMRSWKGIDDFLKAAGLLRSHHKIKWVIIGGGHAETYINRAHEMHLETVVHFTGHLDNPFPALNALDIFALLSTANEGISQAILQAAYLKKALIATATGGLGEVCIDGKTGIQVPPFSSEEVAKAVLQLQNAALRKQLGQNGHELVQQQFTINHMLDQMEEVYRQTVP